MKALLGTALAMALAAAAPALAANAPAQPQQADRTFLEKASEGNVSEVKLGQLAVRKAGNPQVKRFARRMVQDHGNAEQKLRTAMKGSVPTQLSPDAAQLYDKLSKESGRQFDRDYMHAMVDDHTKDVDAFKNEADNGQTPRLKSYAQKTLPVIQQHLQMAQKIDQQVSQSEGR